MLSEGQEILEGRFKIQKRLGSGAFGEIFKVEKKKTGEMYAAKIVSFQISSIWVSNQAKKSWKYLNLAH